MTRTISHTEVWALSICDARWDLRYGGSLTGGDALRPRHATPRMREGRAWGRAVAAWHETSDARRAARDLMHALNEDADGQRAAGVYDGGAHATMAARLGAILDHYVTTTEPLPLTEPEHEIVVPVPSRTGRRASSRYRFAGFLDGIHTDADGRHWIVEFKLRATLSSFEQLTLDRQGRRYAWAWERLTGQPVAGVIWDERLNAAPGDPRRLKGGRVSADKRQMITAESYVAACEQVGHEPDAETVAALGARVWQQRHVVIYRPAEIAEAGAELVALAQRIGDLERGRMPIRTPHPAHCRGCAFREICPNPDDAELVDTLFERVAPKRLRDDVEVLAA